MKSKQEIKEWILNNCVNDDGDIDLKGLDFRDFDGDVVISHMKVKHNLFQCIHEVGGDLSQCGHRVKGDLSQCSHKVGGDLYQHKHEVKGDIRQVDSEFGGVLYTNKLTGYCITEMANGVLKVTHEPEQITMKELEALVGGKFVIVEE